MHILVYSRLQFVTNYTYMYESLKSLISKNSIKDYWFNIKYSVIYVKKNLQVMEQFGIFNFCFKINSRILSKNKTPWIQFVKTYIFDFEVAFVMLSNAFMNIYYSISHGYWTHNLIIKL